MTDALLSPEVYQTDGVALARRLLGCRLVHEKPEGPAGGVIVETEAYMGLSDDAAHSYLIRALKPDQGLELMYRRRPKAKNDRQLCSGPGKLCAALDITRAQYGLSLRGPELYILDRAVQPPITASRRIGVDYAVRCRDELWRFTITGDPFVSRKPKEETP